MRPARLSVALVGWGAIGRTVADLLGDEPVDIVAVAVRDGSLPRAGVPAAAELITDPRDLAALRPDVVAEAAGRDAVDPWGRASLEAGADFVVSSVSAFADADLLASLRQLALEHQAQIHIQAGALGGIDALAAARLLGIDAVEHRIIKPPRAWRGTPAESMCALDSLDSLAEFFRGTAGEAASEFPKNANVAMTTALAGIGPDETTIVLVADPAATTNRHEITAHGAFGRLDVRIDNHPLPENPKTSSMAALNLARTISNRAAPIVI